MSDSPKVYHFTSREQFQKILDSGYLKLTPSNLLEPKDLHCVIVDGIQTWVSETDSVKPVVWLTSSPSPEGHSLECGPNQAKKRVRITLPMKESFEWWHLWSDKNRMNKRWKKRLIQGCRYGTWYISEKEISVEDFLLAEDLLTGEILYQNKEML